MSKVLAINFDDSNEDLYKWTISNNDPDELITRLLREEMNRKSSKTTFTADELNEIAKKAREIFGNDTVKQNKSKEISSKDLNDMFADDSFWD